MASCSESSEKWGFVQPFATIGDMIFHMRALHGIARLAPEGSLTLAHPKPNLISDLFVDDPTVSHVIEFSRYDRLGNIRRFCREKFTRAYILHNSVSSTYVLLFAGISERIGYGEDPWGRLALTRRLYKPFSKNLDEEVAKLSWRFLDLYGIAHTAEDQKPVFSQSRLDNICKTYAHLPRPWVAFGLGASDHKRRWPEEFWGKLSEQIFSKTAGGTVFLCGGEQDRSAAQKIVAGRGTSRENVTLELVIGERLSTVAGLFHSLDLFVGNDSGLFNLAGSIQACPVVGLFGVSRVLTYLPDIIPVTPPGGAPGTSMSSITPDRVTHAVVANTTFFKKHATP